MGGGEQDLTLRAQLKGGEETAKGLDKITDAEKKVGGQVEETAKATDQAEGAQQKLNAAEGDYVAILSRIHPALGGVLDSMLKGSKIAGDLASQNINLTGAFGKATEAIKANAGALKLIGAGGLVVAAIYAIVHAIRLMREEAEKAEKAIRDQIDALNDLEKTRLARMGETERQAAARREGPVSAAESRQIDEAIEQLQAATRFIEDENVARQAVLLAGADAPMELLQRLAVLLERFGAADKIDVEGLKKVSPETRGNLIERMLARREGDISKVLATEAAQIGEVIKRAVEESRVQGGSTAFIEEYIKSLPGTGFKGIDVEQVARIVAGLGGIGPSAEKMGPLFGPDLTSAEYYKLQGIAKALKGEGVEEATPEQVRTAQAILQFLMKAAEKLDKAADATANAAQRAPNVVIHQEHSKHVYPDARAVRAVSINGESDKMRRGIG